MADRPAVLLRYARSRLLSSFRELPPRIEPKCVKFTKPLFMDREVNCNELRKQCRHLVPFLFGEANPNLNQRPTAQLRPTWLAIVAGRARPDEPEVVGGVQGW